MTAVDLEWSAALPAIGLDELNTFAERLIRVDRKYLVRADDIPEIIASVPGPSVLDVAGARSTHSSCQRTSIPRTLSPITARGGAAGAATRCGPGGTKVGMSSLR